MKRMLTKKGNGVVILTADEYTEIIDKVYQANNVIEYAIGYVNEGDFNNDDKIEAIKKTLEIANERLTDVNKLF